MTTNGSLRPVGVFINTHPAQCSIYESGAMVAGCLSTSARFDILCLTLADIDLGALSQTGRLVATNEALTGPMPARVDFWVFNWHFITMAGHLDPTALAALPGLKFTVVLELGDDDPLVLVPKNVFDGYLALDPSVAEGGGVFPFPRPLQGQARTTRQGARDVPVIGSFGFGTPGKGFELLVEAVNREFDRAVVRINVPEGDYISSDKALGNSYVGHIAEMCRRIARPGIEVQFGNAFMTPEALIDWCHDNDLNCFMYTRDQPGLSATTDQAILSGQPLLTLSNATFRHIHPYIPPYPITSLRGAMTSSVPAVTAMQGDWSKERFCTRFETMLERFGLYGSENAKTAPVEEPRSQRARVLVLHRRDGIDGDLQSHGTRFANAIERPATREVMRAACDSIAMAVTACLDLRPNLVISLDHPGEWVAQFAACFGPARPFRVLHALADEVGTDDMPRPIVPFFTNPIATATPGVAWLIGFVARDDVLHPWLDRLVRETSIGRIIVEAQSWDRQDMAQSVARFVPGARASGPAPAIEVHALPATGHDIIHSFAPDAFVVFRGANDDVRRTEAICALALCTERCVVTDPSAPLPSFGDRLSARVDQPLSDRITEGISPQISVVRDFGEWTVTSRWVPRLETGLDHAKLSDAPDIDGTMALSGLGRLDDEDVVRGLYSIYLGREPDAQGLEHHVKLLWGGTPVTVLTSSIGLSPEATSLANFLAAKGKPVPPDSMSVLHVLVHQWLASFESMDDAEFARAANRAGLGRESVSRLTDHATATAADSSRWRSLQRFVTSAEAQHAAEQWRTGQCEEPSADDARGAVCAAWLRNLGQIDVESFVATATRFCFGRPPRPSEVGTSDLSSAAARFACFDAMRQSPEGVAWSRNIDATPLAQRMSAMCSFVSSCDGSPEKLRSHDPSIVATGARLPLRPVRSKRIVWCLVGARKPQPWTGMLSGHAAIDIRWDRSTRCFWTVPDEDGTPARVLTSESCRSGEWLLVSSSFETDFGAEDLVEMDVLMAARSLGLHSACVFEGAGPLESEDALGTAEAGACERRMQALLLADVVLPVSLRAADELVDFWAEHELAEEGPWVVKTSTPNGGAAADFAEWRNYARKVRFVLAEFVSARQSVKNVAYVQLANSSSDTSLLAGAMRRAGVQVHVQPAKDAASTLPSEDAGSTRRRDAWLVVEGSPTGEEIDAWRASIAPYGRKLAVVLPPNASPEALGAALDADRVVAQTPEDLDRINRCALSTRRKLLVAEEKLQLIEPAFASPTPRPVIPKRPQDGSPIRCVAFVERDDALTSHVLAVVEEATTSGDMSVERVDLTGIAQAPLEARVQAALLTADLAIVIGRPWFARGLAHAAIHFGVPSIVETGSGLAERPGVVELASSSDDVWRDALARMLDDRWRQTLRTEALGTVPRTEDERAADLLASLAHGDAFRDLKPLRHSSRAPIRSRLRALQKRPRLSVCISTYNRAGWLAVNLRTLFSQLGEARDAVEVVVVDNAATDETPDVVRPYLERPDFHYHRNPVNVGMLGNLAVTVQRARGDFVWIIGDDDLTQPDAVPSILNAIDMHPDLAMVYVNYGYTSVDDPSSVTDLARHLSSFSVLEPEGPDAYSTVAGIAANNENFYTAIYACVFRRSHALRAFCLDTSGRPFSTMLTCIPTSYYVLHRMIDLPAYWIGKPLLVVNSNVSWAQYGPLFDLEQLPRAWDLAERAGASSELVDVRRANRLWLVEMMWRDIFENDVANNSPYFSAQRVLTRLKHLPSIDTRIATLRTVYERAHASGHPGALLEPDLLFAAWSNTGRTP